jgi:UDP-N-acetyl-D-glucosamine dehydrogenase
VTVPSKTVAVQGLGFVGAAMAVATAIAKQEDGTPWYRVVGVDLPSDEGKRRVDAINAGRFPFGTGDTRLVAATREARDSGALTATTDPAAYETADIVVVDVHLDVDQSDPSEARVDFDPLRAAIRTVGERIPTGALVIVETTVPPGTCRTVVAPELAACMDRRGLAEDAVLLAHSYERVMPGDAYLDSIRSFWRVYAGHTEAAGDACADFLSTVIDTERYPPTRLATTTESEFSKAMENAYRAVNIAFVEEWARLAERIGVDTYDVVNAIRVRPTHNNIRQPGFGVGGYCLTKDPLLAEVSARQVFGLNHLEFPFSRAAIDTNNRMPLETLGRIEEALDGLTGRRLLLLGVTYRQDVADTRYSPSTVFAEEARRRGAEITAYDPCADGWPEIDIDLAPALPDPRTFDAIVLAVPHRDFRDHDFSGWLNGAPTDGQGPLLFDANDVLTPETRRALTTAGHRDASLGRGR